MEINEKYLGKPLFVKRNKNPRFEALINKIKSRIGSWQIPLLSQVGMNTLIKLIVLVLSIQNMPVLHLPNKTLDTMDKTQKSFCWGDGEGKKKLDTLKWKDICNPIVDGGVEIRDTKSNNLTLLAKICWHCLNDDNLLCSKTLKEKYCPKFDSWEAKF